jgi:hypothetical protein
MRCYYAAFVPSHPDGTAAALAESCGCPVIRVSMTGGSEPKRVNAARGAIKVGKYF